MAKKDDARDVWEKVLDEDDAWRKANPNAPRKAGPNAKKIRDQENREGFETMLRTLGGGAAGMAAYALGRKAVRVMSRGRKAKVGDFNPLSPVAAGVVGAAAAQAGGDYPLGEERRRRRYFGPKSNKK